MIPMHLERARRARFPLWTCVLPYLLLIGTGRCPPSLSSGECGVSASALDSHTSLFATAATTVCARLPKGKLFQLRFGFLVGCGSAPAKQGGSV